MLGCFLGDLPAHSSATILIRVTPLVTGTIANTAVITANERDVSPGNDRSTVRTTVAPCDPRTQECASTAGV